MDRATSWPRSASLSPRNGGGARDPAGRYRRRLLVRPSPSTASPPQAERQPGHLAPKIRKEDGRIIWSETAPASTEVLALADRRVFTIFGKRLSIVAGTPPGPPRPPAAPRPGPGALAVSKAGLAIVCGRTAYIIEVLQPEGKDHAPTPSLSGTKFAPGDSFGSLGAAPCGGAILRAGIFGDRRAGRPA
jgi:hypothetical protein